VSPGKPASAQRGAQEYPPRDLGGSSQENDLAPAEAHPHRARQAGREGGAAEAKTRSLKDERWKDERWKKNVALGAPTQCRR
jgi:hypothetical protein